MTRICDIFWMKSERFSDSGMFYFDIVDIHNTQHWSCSTDQLCMIIWFLSKIICATRYLCFLCESKPASSFIQWSPRVTQPVSITMTTCVIYVNRLLATSSFAAPSTVLRFHFHLVDQNKCLTLQAPPLFQHSSNLGIFDHVASRRRTTD